MMSKFLLLGLFFMFGCAGPSDLVRVGTKVQIEVAPYVGCAGTVVTADLTTDIFGIPLDYIYTVYSADCGVRITSSRSAFTVLSTGGTPGGGH